MKTFHNYAFLGLCFLTSLFTLVNCKTPPKPVTEFFTVCKRNDLVKMNECIKKSMSEASRGRLKKGIPELGLIPLEPLVIPRLELNQGSGNFALKTILTNFTFHKLSTNVVRNVNVSFDDKNFIFDVEMYTPEVLTTSHYNVDGQILVVPLRGQGLSEMNFTDLVTKGHTVGKFVTRNGKKHVQLESLKWDIEINHQKSRYWLHNLFNGDKQLGDATNRFLNENGEEAFQALKHLPEEAFGEVFRHVSQKVYDTYTFDELFPPK